MNIKINFVTVFAGVDGIQMNITVWPTCWTPAIGGLIVCECE